MDTTCLEHCLTERERVQFDDDGYLIVEDVLPAELVDRLVAVVERLDTEYRVEKELGPHDSLNLLDFVGKDELFLELLDWPKTFPKVWVLPRSKSIQLRFWPDIKNVVPNWLSQLCQPAVPFSIGPL